MLAATSSIGLSFAALLSLLVGCSDEQRSEPTAPPAPAPVGPAPVLPPVAPAPAPVAPSPVLEDFEAAGDEGAALRKIHALPAWSAVNERYRFLARRGDSGAIHGLLIETPEGFRLVDETTGGGALSIPVTLPEGLAVEPPLRAVTWGAWIPGKSPGWQWRVTRVARLIPPKHAPVLVPPLVATEKKAPEDTVIASQVSRRGGTISFVIKKRNSRVGDGWLIADGSKGPTVARLLLPGEQETYGDQSEFSEQERWVLKKNVRYWLSIRSVRGIRPGKLPVYRARSSPFRDDDAPAPEPVAELAPVE